MKIANIKKTDWTDQNGPGPFKTKRKWLTGLTERCGLGLSMYRLEKGAKAFPAHSHAHIDEAILIISGTATLRYGDEEHALETGDYVTLPAGSGKAHQLMGTSEDGVEYLVMSTQNLPDIITYPDSNKVGVITYMPFDTKEHDGHFIEFYNRDPIGYFDGETDEG